ncbi:hypothetical protein CAC42_4145 [Sphaceloma murrayae]|uniref:Uncharacterized protein n=1 Tax=Sphaceloma murrayae TaxID=2082308 RepID=A0A2K1QLK1_9PEZI|nr:hypothetical protein CAC42_4145 [Sphaceloma murrayae]
MESHSPNRSPVFPGGFLTVAKKDYHIDHKHTHKDEVGGEEGGGEGGGEGEGMVAEAACWSPPGRGGRGGVGDEGVDGDGGGGAERDVCEDNRAAAEEIRAPLMVEGRGRYVGEAVVYKMYDK